MLNLSPVNLLLTILNLLVLLLLMKKFLYQPVLNVIAQRRELIDQQFLQADAAKKEAEQLKTEYEGCLAGARKERENQLMEAKAQARKEYDKIVADADEKAAKILEDAKKAGQEELEKTLRNAQAQIAGLAVAAAAKIVSQTQNKETDSAAYDAFLEEVSKPKGASGNGKSR